MLVDIDILDWASLSPLGATKEEVWTSYLSVAHGLSKSNGDWVGALSAHYENMLEGISRENTKYQTLDPTVLMAIHTSRQLNKTCFNSACGVNLGSSRGATSLFEEFYQDYLDQGKASPQSSPATTLGNISSWVAQDMGVNGMSMSHSITCSTALHAVANACAWINAGFSKQFVAGGSEAPLTPFTIAQMKAMRIYASGNETSYPCRAFDFSKNQNTMVLGKGCGLFLLGKAAQSKFRIKSLGFSTELITHGSSISEEGSGLRNAMQMALNGLESNSVDAVVMHTPGTKKGDEAERNAIRVVFGNKPPLLTNNKWKIGHTLGASGALSMEFALLMFEHQTFIGLPWEKDSIQPRPLTTIMVNAAGFGGNAVSVVLELVK